MIYDFENFVSVCENASKRINPVIKHFDNFYQFVAGQKSRQSKSGTTLPKLATLSAVQFRKRSNSMRIKNSLKSDTFTEVKFLKRNFSVHSNPQKQQQHRGIPEKKKEDILRLIQSFPAAKKRFWMDLNVNASSNDLLANLE